VLSVLVVFQLINFHKVNKLLTMKPAGEMNPRKVRNRRKTRSLTTWAPAPSAVTTPPDDTSADPNPALSARERRSPGEVNTIKVLSRPESALN